MKANIHPKYDNVQVTCSCVTSMAAELGGVVDIEEVKKRLRLEIADLFDAEMVSLGV